MQKVPEVIADIIRTQLAGASGVKKQSMQVDTSVGEVEVTTYWVANVLRVDIKLPKEKEAAV